jgi:hypothetical protein
MNKRDHARRPELEPFESRTLLSSGAVGTPAAAIVSPQPIEKVVELNGTFRGYYKVHTAVPDVGSTYDFNGSGYVHGVGHAFVTGHIQSLGFVAQGRSTGTLFLAGNRGTLTLQLTGPLQKGFSGLPDAFAFKVVGGTGQYTNVDDTGIATLVTIPAHSQMQANKLDHGTFTLVLTSKPFPTA